MRMPLVSTVITSYNYGRYIREAIESVKKQSYRPLECIVVDDASSDDSVAIVQDFLKENPNTEELSFRLVQMGKNSGQLAAFARGIKEAKGVFLNFLDADDVLFPEFVNTHVQVLLNANVGMSVSEQTIIDRNSTFTSLTEDDPCPVYKNFYPLKVIESASFFSEKVLSGQLEDSEPCVYTLIRKNLFGAWLWAPTSNVVFRRDVLAFFDYSKVYEQWRICADGLIFNLVHYVSGSCHINRRLVAYRHHENNNFFQRKSLGCCSVIPKKMRSMCGSSNSTGDSLFLIYLSSLEKMKGSSFEGNYFSRSVLHILPALSLLFIFTKFPLWFSLLDKTSLITWLKLLFLPFAWWLVRLKKLSLLSFGKLS